MQTRRLLIIVLATMFLFGCVVTPTTPDKQLIVSSGCGDCPPAPGAGEAYFTLGEPEFFASSDSFEISLQVSTAETATFSQFTLDYRSDCLLFRGTTPGSTLPGATPFVNQGPGTPSFPVNDPDSDRHVLVNVSGTYAPGCKQEIVRLRFRVLATPPSLCWLRWDDSAPGGNPPNHVITSVPSRIDPGHIVFCDQPIFFGEPSACDCPPLPPAGSAYFSIGPPQFTGSDVFQVGFLVSTTQNVTFSQFTVDYRSDRLEFQGASRGSAVGAGSDPFSNFGPGTPSFPVYSADSDRHVLVSLGASYGPGCNQEIVKLQFRVVAPPPVSFTLHWDKNSPAGNPPNHVNTTDPSQIRPETILFCERTIDVVPPSGEFTLVAINDYNQTSGVDQLLQIPDPLTGVASLVGSLGHDFKDTEALTTLITPGSPTRIFAVAYDRLVEVDPMTGAGTLIGSIGFSDVDGIAFHPATGVLYGVTYGSNKIISINTSTGLGTLVLDHVSEGLRLEDIAFHPSANATSQNEAYVLVDSGSQLVKVNLTTGAETHIHLSGALSLESLVWSRDGTKLYSAADRGAYKDLVTIDLSTNTIAFVSAANSGFGDIEGLGWIETDRLPHSKPVEALGTQAPNRIGYRHFR